MHAPSPTAVATPSTNSAIEGEGNPKSEGALVATGSVNEEQLKIKPSKSPKRRRRSGNNAPKRAKNSSQAAAAAAAVASAINAGAGAMNHPNDSTLPLTSTSASTVSHQPQAQVQQQGIVPQATAQPNFVTQAPTGRVYPPPAPTPTPYDPATTALLMNPHAAAAAAHVAMVAAVQHFAAQQQTSVHAQAAQALLSSHALNTNNIIPAPINGNAANSTPVSASAVAATAPPPQTSTSNSHHGSAVGSSPQPGPTSSHTPPPPPAQQIRNNTPATTHQTGSTPQAPCTPAPPVALAAHSATLLGLGGAPQPAGVAPLRPVASTTAPPHAPQTSSTTFTMAPAAAATTSTTTASPSPVPPAHQHSTPSIPPPLPGSFAAQAAAAHAAAAAAAAAAGAASGHGAGVPQPTSASMNAMLAHMQTWKLNQLEGHIQLLRDTNQPIPQPVAMLLAEARRKEEKRTAKRVANRKSACTSRARKKALVEEMTRTNARLRRQALILALLPDLVVAITVDGRITFCSAQVERVLKHKIQDLVGANMADILVPHSREALARLVKELVAAERMASTGGTVALLENGNKAGENNNVVGNDSGQSSSSGAGENSSSCAAVVSEQSFPPSVVQVTSQGGLDKISGGDVTNNSLSRSTTNLSFGEDSPVQSSAVQTSRSNSSNSDEQAVPSKSAQKKGPTSSDDSLSSSSDVKNLRKASEALNRNVRWHNAQMMGKSQSANKNSAHTDDVTGASVTANNADARLSSLQHLPPGHEATPGEKKARVQSKAPGRSTSALTLESMEENSSSSSDSLLAGVEEEKKGAAQGPADNENSSEDSGYRESGESLPSREDCSSSSDTSSSGKSGKRPKPLAPTCNICLIRDDLTTIWCEVTSSIRTRSLKDELGEEAANSSGQGSSSASDKNASSSDAGANAEEPSLAGAGVGEVKELLLCLRPIRDGEERVGEELRFMPQAARAQQEQQQQVVQGKGGKVAEQCTSLAAPSVLTPASGNDADSAGSTNSLSGPMKKRPPRKRPMVAQVSTNYSSGSGSGSCDGQHSQKRRLSSLTGGSLSPSAPATDTEKSVVESLMLMSNNAK